MPRKELTKLARRVQLYTSENVLEEFYQNMIDYNSGNPRMVHIPRSDVFYVRKKYYEDTGHWVTLDRMERAMYLEGHLNRNDVFEPDKKRDWEDES